VVKLPPAISSLSLTVGAANLTADMRFLNAFFALHRTNGSTLLILPISHTTTATRTHNSQTLERTEYPPMPSDIFLFQTEVTSTFVPLSSLRITQDCSITLNSTIQADFSGIVSLIVSWQAGNAKCMRFVRFVKIPMALNQAGLTILFIRSIGFGRIWLFQEKITVLLAVVTVISGMPLGYTFLEVSLVALQRALIRIVIALRLETIRSGNDRPDFTFCMCALTLFAAVFLAEGVALFSRVSHLLAITAQSELVFQSEIVRIGVWLAISVCSSIHMMMSAWRGADLHRRTFACMHTIFAMVTFDLVIFEVAGLSVKKWLWSWKPLLAMYEIDCVIVAMLTFFFHRSDNRVYTWMESAKEQSDTKT
jgi:hypothetical protein